MVISRKTCATSLFAGVHQKSFVRYKMTEDEKSVNA